VSDGIGINCIINRCRYERYQPDRCDHGSSGSGSSSSMIMITCYFFITMYYLYSIRIGSSGRWGGGTKWSHPILVDATTTATATATAPPVNVDADSVALDMS
jgi:hypothetical protein